MPENESPPVTVVDDGPEWSGADDGMEVMISALEHYSYCPRQCALIHVEGVFEENVFTVRGTQNHERVDSLDDKPARGVPVQRGLPLYSRCLGLIGKADLVELRPDGPYPVEYKLGGNDRGHADLQLCAQALCLEEMFGVPVTRGAVYRISVRQRREVVFDDRLRRQTMQAVAAVRKILQSDSLPPAANDARCPNCSLVDACLPGVVGEPRRLLDLQAGLFRLSDED